MLGIWPLMGGKKPYVAYEHGTLRAEYAALAPERDRRMGARTMCAMLSADWS